MTAARNIRASKKGDRYASEFEICWNRINPCMYGAAFVRLVQAGRLVAFGQQSRSRDARLCPGRLPGSRTPHGDRPVLVRGESLLFWRPLERSWIQLRRMG